MSERRGKFDLHLSAFFLFCRCAFGQKALRKHIKPCYLFSTLGGSKPHFRDIPCCRVLAGRGALGSRPLRHASSQALASIVEF